MPVPTGAESAGSPFMSHAYMGMDNYNYVKGQWYVCKCDDTKIGMKKMQMNQYH